MKCPKCNFEISDDSIFCIECGLHIKNVQRNIDKNKQRCQNCGNEIKKTAKFCNYCGFKQPIKPSNTKINWKFIMYFAIIISLLIIPIELYFFKTSTIFPWNLANKPVSNSRGGVDLDALYGNKSRIYNSYKHNTTEAEKFTNALGITPEQTQNIARAVKAEGVTSQEDLDRKLMWYKGGERLIGSLKYEDNSEITINIDGTDVKATQIADYTGDKLKKKKIKRNNSNTYNEYIPIETARIDIVSDRLISHGYGMYEITGIIKNNSNKTCFDPFVNITTYDSYGNIISQYSPVYISSLPPKESYKFNFHEPNISRYKIQSYGCK